MAEIYNPHDKLARQSLTNIEVAKDFLAIHVPKDILAKFDLNNIELSNRTYIDPQLTEQLSDIVYKVKMLDGYQGYLYFLTEHQSYALPFMPLRIIKYQIAIMEDHLLQNPEATKLPIVFPIIFYTGDRKPYPYTLNLFDLFSDYNFAKQTLMNPAHLVDITQIDDEEIKTHTIIGLLELAQKHIRDPDFSLIVNDLAQTITNIYNKCGSSKNLLLYVECTLYYIISIGNIKNTDQFLEKLNNVPLTGGIMSSLARKWLEEGEAKGRVEDKKEIALAMLAEGSDINFISKVTKLTVQEINELKGI